MEDYPRTLLELEDRFSSEEACRLYLSSLRWPEGFVCPECGHRKGWAMSGDKRLCGHCRPPTRKSSNHHRWGLVELSAYPDSENRPGGANFHGFPSLAIRNCLWYHCGMNATINTSAFDRATQPILGILNAEQVHQIVDYHADGSLQQRIEELADQANDVS